MVVGALALTPYAVAADVPATRFGEKQGSKKLAADPGFRRAVPIRQKAPKYPKSMEFSGIKGSVTLGAILDKSGNLQDIHVVRSTNPWFEAAAIEAYSQWTFTPMMRGGVVVEQPMEQGFEFTPAFGGRELWDFSPVARTKRPEALQWDKPPEIINSVFPVYPHQALTSRKDGKVRVGYTVGISGRAEKVTLLECSSPEFGAAAVTMLDYWEFTPAQKARQKIALPVVVELNFRATGAKGGIPISDGTWDVLQVLRSSPEKVTEMAELDVVPKLISKRTPVFPRTLEASGKTGEAMIEFYITKEGEVVLPRVVSASDPLFGYSAAQAVATWRFAVPRKNGKPTFAKAQIRIEFAF